MDIQALRWFQEVADGATVTEVSDIYMVSQPAVSRALARVENEVGTALFARRGRTLRPTVAGLTFKRHVDAMMADYDDGLAAVSELSDLETGTVGLAFIPSFSSWLVPQLVASFRRGKPMTQFELRPAQRTLDLADFRDSRVDLALTDSLPTDNGLHQRFLFTEPLVLVVPHRHRLASMTDPVSLATLADEPFVLLDASWQLATQVHLLCGAAGFDPQVAIVTDSLTTMRGMVAAGQGVAVMPQLAARQAAAPSEGAAMNPVGEIRLTDQGASRDIHLVWEADRRLLPTAEAFRKHVIAVAPRLAAAVDRAG